MGAFYDFIRKIRCTPTFVIQSIPSPSLGWLVLTSQRTEPKKKKRKDNNVAINVRFATPFSVRCLTCGDFIPKFKKFNTRGELVQGETYYGMRLWRFYFRCPNCLSEFTIKTDPATEDYVCETGVKRNFQPEGEEEKRDIVAESEDDPTADSKQNAMRDLESRARQQQREMEQEDTVELLQALSARRSKLSHDEILERLAREDKEEAHPAASAKPLPEDAEKAIDDEVRQALEEHRAKQTGVASAGPALPPTASSSTTAASATPSAATEAPQPPPRRRIPLRAVVRPKRARVDPPETAAPAPKRQTSDAKDGGGGGAAAPLPSALHSLDAYGDSSSESEA